MSGSRSVDPFGVLSRRCEESPEGVAFRFLPGSPLDARTRPAELTYAGLRGRALALAERCGEHCRPGDRVLLLFPAGLDFPVAFFACVAGGFVAVPAPPPLRGREQRSLPRLRAIVEDAEPSLLLTDGELAGELEALLAGDPVLARLPRLAVGGDAAAADGERPHAGGELLCLQYTSGSTAAPKGVMVGREALWHNSEMIRRAWGYGPESHSLMWVPNFHDDGLVHGVVQPVHSGFPCTLMSPLDLIRRPARWLEAMTRLGATHGGGPNFAYELCVRKTGEADKEGLDLSAWEVAYDAAEPVRLDTLQAFHRAFRDHGFRWSAFRPSFGLAEATLLVTTGRPEAGPQAVYAAVDALEMEQRIEALEEPVEAAADGTAAAPRPAARALVSCGPPVEGCRLAVVDVDSRLPLPEGEVGEVWIASPALAAGYWRRPEATAEIFGAFLAGSGDGPYLRTGDLGFLRGGELYVTGRLKDLIILHGRNVYPQDVELAVERAHPALRPGCSVAFAVDAEGEERLVVAAELAGQADAAAVVDAVRQAVAEEHELPVWAVALLPASTVPKTSSGKLQRRECRRLFLAGELEALYVWRAGGAAAAAPTGGTREPRSGGPAALDQRGVEELLAWLRGGFAARLDLALADERRSLPPHAVLELGNRGVLGLQVSPRWGGLGLGMAAAMRVYQQLGAIDLTIASLVSAHNTLGLRAIEELGGERLRGELLPRLATGRELAAFALTEAEAGSNPRALAARAEPLGDGRWRLDGEKTWSGSATWAGAITVVVRHAEAAERGGASVFVVRPGMPGVVLGPETPTLGLRSMVQGQIRLDGVVVGADSLLGEAGGGMEIAQRLLTRARLALAAICLGALQRCARLGWRFARRRTISTGRLADNPVQRVRLGGLAAAIEALAPLVDGAAARLDAGEPVPDEVLIAAKVAGSELLWQAADDLVQSLGSRGYADAGPAARLLRDARAFRIVEGPNEALCAYLGARLHHDAEALLAHLEADLGQPRVARRLRWAAEELAPAPDGSPFGSVVDALRWSHYQLGMLFVDGVLWAAAAGARGERGARWAEQRFEARLEAALDADRLQPAVWGDEELSRRMAAFAAAVGDPESGGWGEDRRLDPLLDVDEDAAGAAGSRAAALPGRRPTPPAAEPAPPGGPAAGGDEEAIAGWLCRWIAARQGAAPESLERDRAFEYHGLDSVTSVSLVEELGAWLGRPLPATLVWTHPTIARLARHLAAGPEEERGGDGAPAEPAPLSETR